MHTRQTLPPAITAGLAGLLCLNALAAQTYTTNPPGWESSEYAAEKGYAQLLGRYPNQRLQWAVSGLPQKPLKISAMAFRRDGRHFANGSLEFGAFGGHGRSWTRVTLALGETTVSGTSFSTTFAKNIKANYRNVFTGKVTWANATAKPTLPTTNWGAGGLNFPFNTTYSWSGKNTLLTDFQMTGGTLANNGRWFVANSYFLDGIHTEDYLYGRFTTLVFPKCVDNSQRQAALSRTSTTTYAWRTRNKINDGAILYDFQVYGAAPRRGLVYAIGPEGSLSLKIRPGHLYPQDIRACNLLWIGIHKAVLAYPVADTFGNWRLKGRLGPAYNFVLGHQLYTQTAYHDSKTGHLMLTGVSKEHIQRRPPNPRYDGNQLHSRTSPFTTGFTEGIGLPLARLRLQ